MLAQRCVLRGTALPAAPPPARRAAAAPGLVVEAAHKKGGGSTKNKSDSNAQRLGVKIYGEQPAMPGNIIIRQRGTKARLGGHPARSRRGAARGRRPALVGAPCGMRSAGAGNSACGRGRRGCAPCSEPPGGRPQWTPGPGTGMGKDHTIYAVAEGLVKFERSSVRARVRSFPGLKSKGGASPSRGSRSRPTVERASRRLQICVVPRVEQEQSAAVETRRTRKWAMCAALIFCMFELFLDLSK